jgi:hypothetical protein
MPNWLPSACATTVALFLAAAQAQAASAHGIDFAVERGPGAERCPDRDALAARVGKHLADAPGGKRAQVAERVAVTIVRTDQGYVATLATSGGEGGMRRLIDRSEDCAGLVEALALTLAMIADGGLVSGGEPAGRPAVAVARPWEVGMGALGSTGMLDAASLGPAVHAVWQPWPRLTTALSTFWLPGRRIGVEQGAAEVTLLAGLGSVCLGLLPYGGRVYPALCGQVGVGAVHGAGDELVDQRSVWRPWLAGGGSLSLGVRIFPRWTLAVSAGRLFSLKREQFVVGGYGRGPVYDSGTHGWLGQLGLLLRIP